MIANKSAGNNPNTNFFANANMNRVALIPGAAGLVSFANKSLGTGTATAYASRVQTSVLNGAGPAIAPVQAPFSFTQFATGKRVLASAIKKRLTPKS